MQSRKVHSIKIDNQTVYTHNNWINTNKFNSKNLPTREAINAIDTGDRIKICDGVERFYVVITDIEKDGNTFIGACAVITTNLLYNKNYNYGDVVFVYPENIYEIVTKQFFEQKVMEYQNNYTKEQLSEKIDSTEKIKYVKHDEI